MELGFWNSIIIVTVFSIVFVALDEYVAKPWREKRWERQAAAGDKDKQFLQGCLGRLGEVGAQAVVVGIAGIDDGLGHGLAAATAGRLGVAVDTYPVVRAFRDDFATMKTGLCGVCMGFGHGPRFYPIN